jgi:tetratricopeptide (TPR) repeat protein
MRSYLEGAVEQYRRAGDVSGVAGSLAGLGDVALMEGDYAGARRYYAKALRDASIPRDYMYFLAGIAAVAAQSGEAAAAARLWGAVLRIESELDQGFDPGTRELYADILDTLDAAEIEAGRALSTEEACDLAREIVGGAPSEAPAPGGGT